MAIEEYYDEESLKFLKWEEHLYDVIEEYYNTRPYFNGMYYPSYSEMEDYLNDKDIATSLSDVYVRLVDKGFTNKKGYPIINLYAYLQHIVDNINHEK